MPKKKVANIDEATSSGDSKELPEGAKNMRFIQIFIIIAVALVIILVFLLLHYFGIGGTDFSGGYVVKDPASFKYTAFQQICDREEGYFENISLGAYGEISKRGIIEIKNVSVHCQSSKAEDISQEEFENLKCGCIEWKGKKVCQEGYTLSGGSLQEWESDNQPINFMLALLL